MGLILLDTLKPLDPGKFTWKPLDPGKFTWNKNHIYMEKKWVLPQINYYLPQINFSPLCRGKTLNFGGDSSTWKAYEQGRSLRLEQPHWNDGHSFCALGACRERQTTKTTVCSTRRLRWSLHTGWTGTRWRLGGSVDQRLRWSSRVIRHIPFARYSCRGLCHRETLWT
jgi:hypothetical protein